MIRCLPFLTRKVNRVNRGAPETKARRCGPAGRPTSWLKNLKDNRVDIVFTYQDHYEPVFPIEDQWATENPEDFKLIFANSKVRIFSLLEEKL